MTRALVVAALVLAAAGCRPERAERSGPEHERRDAGARRAPRPVGPPPTPWVPAVIAHCGLGTPPADGGGCEPAVARALAVLEKGGDPLDAAAAGVVVLEDDPRYNAGTGSVVRLDGHTVQMDAAVMDSSGRFGAVIGLEKVKNPVMVARAVADTPHRILAGEGAILFAEAMKLERVNPQTPAALAEAARARAELAAGNVPAAWQGFDWRRAWNYARGSAPPPAAAGAGGTADPGGDTVGVTVRTADGRFAAALSTGGYTVVLNGRVGDVPIPGAGLHAGPFGAIAATGRGELIIDEHLARTVHGWLAEGATAKEAAERGVELLDGEAGLIVITATDAVAAARGPMASCTRSLGTGVR